MDFLTIILLILYFIAYIFCICQTTTFLMIFSLIMVFVIACFFIFSLGFEFLAFLILIIYVGAIAVLFLFMVMLFDRAEYKIFNISTIETFNLKFYNIVISIFLSYIFCYILLEILSLNTFSDLIMSNKTLDIKNDFSILNLLFTSYDKTFIQNNLLNIFTNNDLLLNNFNSIDILFYNYIQENTSLNFIDLNNNFNIYHSFFKNDNITFLSDIELIGINLYYNYFIVLFLSGFGLLIAMIGCIIITKSSIMKIRNNRIQLIEVQLNRYSIISTTKN